MEEGLFVYSYIRIKTTILLIIDNCCVGRNKHEISQYIFMKLSDGMGKSVSLMASEVLIHKIQNRLPQR